MQGTPVMLSLG